MANNCEPISARSTNVLLANHPPMPLRPFAMSHDGTVSVKEGGVAVPLLCEQELSVAGPLSVSGLDCRRYGVPLQEEGRSCPQNIRF